MKLISVFLEGMNLVSEQAQVTEKIQEVLFEVFRCQVDLEYKKGKVFLQVSPVVRSEIFIQKEKFISMVNERIESLGVKVSRII